MEVGRGNAQADARAAPNSARAPVSDARAPVSNARAPVSNARAPVSNAHAPVSNARAPVSNARGPNSPGPANSPRRRNRQPDSEPVYDKLIVVSGFPPYTQAGDLNRTFSRFGNVRVERIISRNLLAILSYTTPEEAQAAVQASRKVNIYGEMLEVRQYTHRDNKSLRDAKQNGPKRDFPKTKQKGMIVDPTEIDLSGNFHQQVDHILASVRLTQEQATAVSTLYADVERVLQALWPGCAAVPFGSITTGLGIKTSDADCFLAVPHKHQPLQHTFVNKAKRVLNLYPQLFDEILSIPRANTPIVKFFHLPTQTNCDLSFKTPLGTQNSKLIAFLLHADPRLIPVAVIIKYWVKVHGLSGTGRLTNYALTMMVIFYLQQLKILPSVEWLQRDPNLELIVDYWNTGFMAKKELLPPCLNTSSISELLGGFFQFYSEFNFEEMIVCPYMGVAVRKDVFLDLGQLPKEFSRYVTNVTTKLTPPMRVTSAMCVQDPFEQCHNVASAISGKLASEIKTYFKFAATAYQMEKQNGCKNFLKAILIDKPKIVRLKAHPEYRMNLFPKVITNIKSADWISVLRDIMLEIFKTMLKVNLVKSDDKPTNPETKKIKEKYTGNITKSIWKRKQFTRLYSAVMDLSFTQKQTRITEEILAVEKETFNIEFQLIITFVRDPKTAVVSVRFNTGDMDPFKEFGKFFLSIIHSWLPILLKPYGNTSDKLETTINNEELDSDDDTEENNEADTGDNDDGVDNDSSDEDATATGDANDSAKIPAEVCAADNSENDKSNQLAHTETTKGSKPTTTDTQS